jgi:hypothetical protein
LSHIDLELPYYVINASGTGSTFIYFNIVDEEGGTGFSDDTVADAMRDAVEALSGVTVNSLTKHTESTSNI